MREVYKSIRDQGTQAAWVDKMLTRRELYDLIKYYDYENIDNKIAREIDDLYKSRRERRYG